jgi:Putative prokaryotic signal transducing protein
LSSSSDDPWENDPLRQRVRKIKPQLSEGELVRVIGASNQAEAEMIQGMLLEEGVPSLLRRALGSDVPDFLAAGRRDVLVPASGLTTAREVLLQAEMISETPTSSTAAGRVLAGLLAAVVLVGLVVWIGAELLG